SEKDEASKLVINVPSPCRISTRPIALKPLKASRTADRDTSNASANFSTDSSLSPDTSSPCFTRDRKSTRLNSSHVSISYAVFCLKKKKNKYTHMINYWT